MGYKSIMETSGDVQSFMFRNAQYGFEPKNPFPVHAFMLSGIKELFDIREIHVPWDFIPLKSALGDFSHLQKPANSYALMSLGKQFFFILVIRSSKVQMGTLTTVVIAVMRRMRPWLKIGAEENQ